MRIAVDAMGGDFAPGEIVQGAIQAAQADPEIEVILVGQPAAIQAVNSSLPANVSVHPALEVIAMDEHPAGAVKSKKDASIVVATRLVKQGEADAVVSAGSTGAQMAAALLGLGRIKGIERPGIATVLPTARGGKLLLDAGANADAKPAHLFQYALMGSIYAEKILKISNPRVALLNIGSEETKGSELYLAAHELLKAGPFNFTGNIEGREVPRGKADVIVCDGFVGNVLLKFAEGLAVSMFGMIKDKITSSFSRKLGAALVKPGLKEIAHGMDYAEYGGSPLLGVNGVSIVCHGSSKAKAIRNAIRVAGECVQSRYIEAIQTHLPERKR
ncbi:MAG TPA: phosphate acyltransferase PlsX [Desulfobacteria bacterium]|nr:phosphate acyltransferase PlsX [Desulfobacteria bacterium]